jgi:hypothetical protein
MAGQFETGNSAPDFLTGQRHAAEYLIGFVGLFDWNLKHDLHAGSRLDDLPIGVAGAEGGHN